jgi:hypothetical protein
MAKQHSDEKRFEKMLCELLNAAKERPDILRAITIHKASVPKVRRLPNLQRVRTLADLFDGIHEYSVFKDTSAWWKHCDLLVEVSGGMTPDIVVRSHGADGARWQNRILIEVKDRSELGGEQEASQAVRYLLHLLATTSRDPGHRDLRRGVLLAAPARWFDPKNKTARKWRYFVEKYSDLARIFDVTIGEIHVEELESIPNVIV